MLIFVKEEEKYKIGELAEIIDRSVICIKEWEDNGYIPKAKRDSRGWRYYTEEDIGQIQKIMRDNPGGFFYKKRF